MFDPQRAILVERSDALGDWYKLGARLVGGFLDERCDRLPGRSSFQEGSGSSGAAACAGAATGKNGDDTVGSTANAESTARRLIVRP